MSKLAKKERRSAHRTQWAAQFAVASELCKRDYQVAFTMGNHPLMDLMVLSPNGVPFHIDVKGLYKPNYWLVRRQAVRDKLFYVFAYVPDNAQNQFFVLTQKEVNRGIQINLDHARSVKRSKGAVFEKAHYVSCIPWEFPLRYQDSWDVLPQ